MSRAEYNKLCDKLYEKTEDGMQFTLREKDCSEGDCHLIFNNSKEKIIVTIHKNRVPHWVEFSNDEPMLLEECPPSFYYTIIENIEKGNYKIVGK